MVKVIGLAGDFVEIQEYQRFMRLVLDTERLFCQNMHL